jgi:hypothetical protein
MASRKSNVLTIRVPHDLKERIEKSAHRQGVSMNQFAIYVFTRELSELETASFFQEQYANKSAREIFQEFDEVMSKVPSRKRRPAWDQLV